MKIQVISRWHGDTTDEKADSVKWETIILSATSNQGRYDFRQCQDSGPVQVLHEHS